MHIADGIVPLELAAAGWVVSLTATHLLGRNLEADEVPRLGMLSAAAFVVSMAQFPVAGVSMHLGLHGLLGVLLGRRAFPVVFATLCLQALLQHGGFLALGLNTFNMGVGALLGWGVWSLSKLPAAMRAFAAGFVGSIIPALLMAAEFSLSGYGRGFFFIAGVYGIVALVEGAVATTAVGFFRRAKPELLPQASA